MEKYFVDKVLPIGTLFRAESDKAYLIESLGTNSTTKLTVKIAGAPSLEIIDKLASLTKINTNLTGPLALGPCFLVVPPDKPILIEGESGKYGRIIGNIIQLEPGEVIPPDLAARFTEQPRKYISYQAGTYSSAAAASIAEYQEENVLTFTCPAGEKWLFNSIYMGEVWTTADTIKRELLVTRIYVDDKPLDIVEKKMGPLGIYSSAAPHPPREDLNFVPFTLEEKPIELTPGRTLRITWINVGAAATLTTGETLEARVKLLGVKEYI